MVIAAVMADIDDLPKLSALGIKDSKLLLPAKRESLFEIITSLDCVSYEIKTISPKEIDDTLNSENFNLNWLEAVHSSMLINSLKPDRAVLDLPSNNMVSYVAYVKKNLNINCEIIAEHKADVNHVIVGAASILAKVTRDREIEKIKFKIGHNFGSGYPSDPKTVSFLKSNYHKFEGIFRKTWQSYRKVADAKNQSDLSQF
jgi:ribonuclease HII